MKPIHYAALGLGIITGMLMFAAAHAETMVVERVVPPGATLTYSEDGRPLRTIAVPEGKVRVIIEFDPAVQHRKTK